VSTSSKSKPVKQTEFFPIEKLLNGLIHNINNPLTIIKVRAQLLIAKYPQNQALKTILENVGRIENILGSLAYKIDAEKNPTRQLINLNKLIQVELNYLQGDLYFKHHIARAVYLEENLPLISGVYRYISQGFLAIVAACMLNMRDSPSKNLQVHTFKEGEQVFLEISDTGNLLTTEDIMLLDKGLHDATILPNFDGEKASVRDTLITAAKILSDFSDNFLIKPLSPAGMGCQVTFKIHPYST
jgi:K+-sensing histidine kinase KdpD